MKLFKASESDVLTNLGVWILNFFEDLNVMIESDFIYTQIYLQLIINSNSAGRWNWVQSNRTFIQLKPNVVSITN